MALTAKEKATWIRTVVAEARRDEVGLTAQRRICGLMDYAASKGGFCDHDDCMAERDKALQDVYDFLWKVPPKR